MTRVRTELSGAAEGVTMGATTAPPSAVERSAIRKVSIRLVPFVALMFFVNMP